MRACPRRASVMSPCPRRASVIRGGGGEREMRACPRRAAVMSVQSERGWSEMRSYYALHSEMGAHEFTNHDAALTSPPCPRPAGGPPCARRPLRRRRPCRCARPRRAVSAAPAGGNTALHSQSTTRPSPRPLVRLVLVLVLVDPPGALLAHAVPSIRAGPADARAGAAARASADEWYPFVEELERQANGILTVVLSTRKQEGGNHPLPILVCKRAVTTRCPS